MPKPKSANELEAEAAKKVEKANADLMRACKNDEGKKAESAIAKGADINYENDKGNSLMHIAAGFGSLSVIRVLHKAGASLEKANQQQLTPLQMAQKINEENAAALIEALLAGKTGDEIGAGEGEEEEEGEEAGEPSSERAAAPSADEVGAAAAAAAAAERAAAAEQSRQRGEQCLSSLLEQLLSPAASEAVLVRALGEDSAVVRATAAAAGLAVVRKARDSHAGELLSTFEALLDAPHADPRRAELLASGLLSLAGELGGHLPADRLSALLARYASALASESTDLSEGAARGLGAALEAAVGAGRVSAGEAGEVGSMYAASLAALRQANTPLEARGAALGIGAALRGAGVARMVGLGAMVSLHEAAQEAAKAAPSAREGAVLALEQLSLQLGSQFEPFAVPMMRGLVALYADKEKRVADAAVRAVRAILSQLSPLAVKLVLPALYDGMEGVQWRPKVECLMALAVLAKHAPFSVGPCLPDAIPKVVECLASTNSKVTPPLRLPMNLPCTSPAPPLHLPCIPAASPSPPDLRR